MSRGKLDETLAAMFSNPKYSTDYLFYAHMIGQCSIKIMEDLPAPAGVMFHIDHYNLIINPEKFDEFPLIERLAILKHEMLHILYDHIFRGKDIENLKPYTWNLATDCALNQQINDEHLPECGVRPANLGKMFDMEIPPNKAAEQYYDMLKDYKKDEEGQGQGQGQPGEGEDDETSSGSGDQTMDSHDIWEESIGDRDLQKDVTKNMVEKAQNETLKSAGKLPSACADALEIFSKKSEVDWKKVLRGIVGNKKANRRSTIMRRDRRLPKRDDLRGKTKDRTFELLVVTDVSGSMSNEAINATLAEVQHVCDVTKTAVKMIQVDTQAQEPEELTKKTKVFTRKGSGGTLLYSAIEKAQEHNIPFQAVVVLTDGYLFGNEVKNFEQLRKKVIWLVEQNGKISNDMEEGLMRAFKLSGL